jgi:hypothetical protein
MAMTAAACSSGGPPRVELPTGAEDVHALDWPEAAVQRFGYLSAIGRSDADIDRAVVGVRDALTASGSEALVFRSGNSIEVVFRVAEDARSALPRLRPLVVTGFEVEPMLTGSFAMTAPPTAGATGVQLTEQAAVTPKQLAAACRTLLSLGATTCIQARMTSGGDEVVQLGALGFPTSIDAQSTIVTLTSITSGFATTGARDVSYLTAT